MELRTVEGKIQFRTSSDTDWFDVPSQEVDADGLARERAIRADEIETNNNRLCRLFEESRVR